MKWETVRRCAVIDKTKFSITNKPDQRVFSSQGSKLTLAVFRRYDS